MGGGASRRRRPLPRAPECGNVGGECPWRTTTTCLAAGTNQNPKHAPWWCPNGRETLPVPCIQTDGALCPTSRCCPNQPRAPPRRQNVAFVPEHPHPPRAAAVKRGIDGRDETRVVFLTERLIYKKKAVILGEFARGDLPKSAVSLKKPCQTFPLSSKSATTPSGM